MGGHAGSEGDGGAIVVFLCMTEVIEPGSSRCANHISLLPNYGKTLFHAKAIGCPRTCLDMKSRRMHRSKSAIYATWAE